MTNWIEVSRERLRANYRTSLEVAQRESGLEAAVLAVVKANAYGHGAAVCAPVLACAGAEWLGVTDAAEGAAVRTAMIAAGIEAAAQPQVLVMCGHLAEDAAAFVKHRLTPVVWTPGQMMALASAATKEPLRLHLEVDTGMSRQGIAPGEALRELLRWLAAEPRLRLDGVMTHFASAEVAGSAQTAVQRERFAAALGMVMDAGLQPAWVHAGNTSALDNGADGGTLAWLKLQVQRLGARPMVREGLGLYGYCLPLEGLVASDGVAERLHPQVRPVMTWKTRVLAVTEIAAGTAVGYNGTFVAERPMRLALLPVGYADGLRRELSCSTGNKGGWVMIGGLRAGIVGRISMNLTTVDVSGIESVDVGDEVDLLGEGVTAEDHAALAGTIAYEILCGARGPVVPR